MRPLFKSNFYCSDTILFSEYSHMQTSSQSKSPFMSEIALNKSIFMGIICIIYTHIDFYNFSKTFVKIVLFLKISTWLCLISTPFMKTPVGAYRTHSRVTTFPHTGCSTGMWCFRHPGTARTGGMWVMRWLSVEREHKRRSVLVAAWAKDKMAGSQTRCAWKGG